MLRAHQTLKKRDVRRVKDMNEKILTVLVIVSLVLSVFNLVLLLRTNNGTQLLGQSSGVTWKKVDITATYSTDVYVFISRVPLWNVTVTLQWSNGTISVYGLGDTFPYPQSSYTIAYIVQGIGGTTMFYGNIVDSSYRYLQQSPTANITSAIAYEIQPPS